MNKPTVLKGLRPTRQIGSRYILSPNLSMFRSRDWDFKWSHLYQIWQESQQHYCRGTYQILERPDVCKSISRGFESSWGLAVRFLTHDNVIKWKPFPYYWPLVRGIHQSPDEFPAQRPVTRSFDVFFDMRLNKRLSKQSWGLWFETLSRPSWRHRNVNRGSRGQNIGWLFYYLIIWNIVYIYMLLYNDELFPERLTIFLISTPSALF